MSRGREFRSLCDALAGPGAASAGLRRGVANWEQTLIPPDDDLAFSFAGEKVREKRLNSNPVTGDKFSNSCASRAPLALDGTPNSIDAPVPWIVDQDNKWGADTVGFGPCAVEAYRCAQVSPCTYVLPQQMYIKSPADADFTYVYSNNVLGAGIGIPIPTSTTPQGRELDLRQFFGFVSSKRFTPLGGGKESTGFKSSKDMCASYINLDKCPPY